MFVLQFIQQIFQRLQLWFDIVEGALVEAVDEPQGPFPRVSLKALLAFRVQQNRGRNICRVLVVRGPEQMKRKDRIRQRVIKKDFKLTLPTKFSAEPMTPSELRRITRELSGGVDWAG